ncbi:MAG: CPBP family intramembrane glutamic endopeptidase [Thermoanaerobaculia bacterium]
MALLIGGLFLAALVAPFAYSALRELLPGARWPFSRVFNRTAMVIAALLLFVLRRPLGLSLLPALFARRSTGRKLGEIVAGFGAALLGVTVAGATAWVLGLLGPAASPYAFFAGRTATVLVSGLVVGGIEETLFRGMMLVSLAATIGFPAAAIASSGAYALVHLLVSDPTLGREGSSLDAGFAYLVHAVGRQLEPASLLPLFGIFLCGLVAAVVVRRSGALYIAIGLHAGWVFAFQVLRHATRPLVEIPGHSYLATHHYLVGTVWAWAGVILAGALALAWVAWVRQDRAGGALDR